MNAHDLNGLLAQLGDLPLATDLFLPDETASVEDLLNGIYVIDGKRHQFTGLPDWHTPPDPTERTSIFVFNRHRWFINLAHAYLETHNQAALDLLEASIQSWYQQIIVERGKPLFAEPIDAGIRLRVWAEVLRLLYPSDALKPQTVETIFSAFVAQMTELERHYSNIGNHSFITTIGMMTGVCLLPEHPRTPYWRTLVKQRVEEQVSTHVFRDGGQNEASTTYHALVLAQAASALKLEQLAGVELAPFVREYVQRMIDFQCAITFPDSSHPMWGDSPANTLAHNAGMPIHELANQEGLYLLSQGGTGQRPNLLSRVFPESGVTVLRTGWLASENPSMVFFNWQPYLRLPNNNGWHVHADLLSVLYWSRGRLHLQDSGKGTYNYGDPWRYYFKGTAAHNTVTVDGLPQIEIDDYLIPQTELAPIPGGFEQHGEMAIAWAGHTGYQRLPQPVTLFRHIALHHDWLLVCDEALGSGEHVFTNHWHFDRGPVCPLSEQSFTCEAMDTSHLLISTPDCSENRVVEGQTAPLQGWVSEHWPAYRPAPVLEQQRSLAAPARWYTLLVPWEGKAPGVRWLPAHAREVHFEINDRPFTVTFAGVHT